MDSLFEIEPTKPTKLQAARRALADAERELGLIEGRNCEDYGPYERAVQRCAEIVKAEELAELNNSKQNIV